jgi:asparagine synthase (glutamine-hydrolysing)
LITAIAAITSRKRKNYSLAIGLDANAPDVAAARKVVFFLNTEHNEIYFTVQDGIEIIQEVIRQIETYDVIITSKCSYVFCCKSYKKIRD